MDVTELRSLRSVITIETRQLSLDEFVTETQPVLERALVARFGVHDGMDAAAEALAYCLSNWDRLRVMDNPIGYLYRVGESKGRRWSRRLHRAERLVDGPSTADPASDVDLERALMRLPAAQRIAVVLVHTHGHSYAEAAALMSVPVTTVTNHLNRGLKRLRQLMEE